MKLSTFQIINCFGFRDSGTVDLQNKRSLIYLLGRNSSGKSSLLKAIKYFERGIVPSQQSNFQNFNDSRKSPALIATFEIGNVPLSEAAFTKALTRRFSDLNITDSVMKFNPKLEEMRGGILSIYKELIRRLNEKGRLTVWKMSDGHYHFIEDQDYYERRSEEVTAVIDAAREPNRTFSIRGGALPRESVIFNHFEDLLYQQSPNIYLFNEKYSLLKTLPDRIVADWANHNDVFEAAFVNYLGQDDVNQFLDSNDPDDREKILSRLTVRMKLLTDKVNQHPSQTSNTDLLEIRLHEKDGIQLTVQTDKKKSYYSHLSDNTKFLFAYYLYQETHKISGDTLLFDEPNNGFHPTAQEFLLNFLKQLSDDGNLVVVATHSEHLIDLDLLPAVRLMSVDDANNIIVKNHLYNQAKSSGDYLSLQPILDAIGLRYGSQIAIKDKVNVTEGITDLLYLRGFNKLLAYGDEVNIAPARGDGTMLNVIPLLISQGLNFKIILDVGTVKGKIESDFGIDGKFIYEISIPAEFIGKMDRSGIEDLFSKVDFEKLLREVGHVPSEQYPHVSNGHYMRKSPDKRLVAQHLYENIPNYAVADFEPETIENFRKVLNFCHNPDWYLL